MAPPVQEVSDGPNSTSKDAVHVDIEDSVVQKLAEDSKFALVTSEAKIASDAEQAMTVREAIRRYPKAIFWSILLSTAIAQEGYDSVLISNFFALPAFTEKYGTRKPGAKTYQISAPWQAGLSDGARVGEILGLSINGLSVIDLDSRKL
jgi:SP family general alpha glucoside:H+ symporter-like MFS transporter